MSTLRCFIAIDLSPEIHRSLEALSRQLQAQPGKEALRWVRTESIHLTLEFLGDLSAERVAEVAACLGRTAMGHSPFTLSVAGLGCFPEARRPRVLWMGVEEPTGALARLQAGIRSACAAAGVRVDGRPFSPHLTLARVRRESGTQAARFVSEVLAGSADLAAGDMTADALHLYRSDLRPEGAVYARLHSASLPQAVAG